jgi:magnesium chelatase subunit D
MDYPFAALVGQEQLKLALLLNAVHPAVGGVLVRGEKGTAKSTAARGLAALLPPLSAVVGCPFRCDPAAPWPECPHCSNLSERSASEVAVPFVDLPIGATEDRVLGTLDFERALREGRRAFQPGLLAAAHRGVLYIDEVNLLPDHLVDVLLDAAALGVNAVQREGVSVAHPARFILVGTMNPEEGDLRPQFLDRFGLMVSVTGSREPDVRAEVVRRRMAFEADPAAFAATWSDELAALRVRITGARQRLPGVTLSDGLLSFISQLCCEFEVDGMRADLVIHRAARAHAAWEGRDAVTAEDIRVVAELALPHRRRRKPFEQPGLDRDRLDDLVSRMTSPPEAPAPPDTAAKDEGNGETPPSPPPAAGSGEKTFDATAPQPVRGIQVKGAAPTSTLYGRRNPAPSAQRGHYVRAVPDPAPASIAIDATVRAAVRRGQSAGHVSNVPNVPHVSVERVDLHGKQRIGRTGTLVLFVVDASGSMAARQRMEAVKGAVLGVLQDAYEQRDEVGVIAFRGLQAELILPPTRSVELAERALRALPTGGRTPLAHALLLAHETSARERHAHPDSPVLLVVLSDGKANVPLPDTAGDPWAQACEVARELAAAKVPALVLDTDSGFVRLGRAPQLAEALGARCLPLVGLSAESIVLNMRG